MTLIWPVMDEQAGWPVRLRAPEIWRVRPDLLETAWTGTLRVVGNHLATPDAKPMAVLQRDDDVPRALHITGHSSTLMLLKMPADLAPGRHVLWVHNGTGGRAGWSEPIDIGVQPPEPKDGESDASSAEPPPRTTHAAWMTTGKPPIPDAQAVEPSQLDRLPAPTIPAPTSPQAPPEAVPLGLQDMQTPSLGAATDTTFPGETLAATGANLHGTLLKVWVEGLLFDLEPMRTTEDRLQAIVPKTVNVAGEERALPHATMLIWPVRDGVAGTPLRINAPALWWLWPARALAERPDQQLRLFGRNLVLPEALPRVMLRRLTTEGKWDRVELTVTESEPYHITVRLPADLKQGRYQILTHNGTGDDWGYSEPVTFEVTAAAASPEIKFSVEPPAEGNDLTSALEAAIAKAAEAGGGTVICPPGRFEIRRELVLPGRAPIVLRGAGMGQWNRDSDTPEAGGTVLVGPGRDDVTFLIAMRGRGSRLQDLTLIHDGSAMLGVVGMLDRDQTLQRVRVVRNPVHGRYLPNVRCRYNGKAQQQILDCELLFGFQAVRIENGTDYVRIADSHLRGRFDGGVVGARADAVENRGGSNMIMERCSITSEDRAGGRLVSRTCLLYDSGIRHCYIAHNRSVDVGAHSSVDGISDNISEQYLFHRNGPGGGVFRIEAAAADAFVLQNADLSMEADWDNGQWIAFIAAGRGAGQFRELRERDGNTVRLTRPWRIIPDADATVIIERVFRQNLVYHNHIEPATSPEEIDPTKKTAGIYWYQLAFDNVTASNTIRHAGTGIAITTTPTAPAAWNLVRDNRIEMVRGKSAGTSFVPMFYNENVHAREPEWRAALRHWCGVGNVFRSNTCRGGEAAALAGWFQYTLDAPDYTAAADRGLVMSIIEQNTFDHVQRGILLAAPANWSLIRANRITGEEKAVGPIETHEPHQLYAPLHLP